MRTRWFLAGALSLLLIQALAAAIVLTRARGLSAREEPTGMEGWIARRHANDGSGETLMGKHMYPLAPDMRKPATQSLSDGELFYIIQNGIRLTGMPGWGGSDHDAEDSWKLVHFIRHLPDLTIEERKQMEKLNPKGPEEWKEEEEEERFLKGEGTNEPQQHHHH